MDTKKSGDGTTKACQSNSVVQPLKILRECEQQKRIVSGAKGFSSDMGRGEHDWDKNGTEKVAAFTNSHWLLSRDIELRVNASHSSVALLKRPQIFQVLGKVCLVNVLFITCVCVQIHQQKVTFELLVCPIFCIFFYFLQAPTSL